jgi:hypothetical protein
MIRKGEDKVRGYAVKKVGNKTCKAILVTGL